jgi:COX assembly protein 2
MQAIKDCHANNPYLKFLGVCNDEKTALNMCLRGEVSSLASEMGEASRAAVRSLPRIESKRLRYVTRWLGDRG